MWSDLIRDLCFFSNPQSFVVGIWMNVKFIASWLSIIMIKEGKRSACCAVNWLDCPVS